MSPIGLAALVDARRVRLQRVRAAMGEQGVDTLLLSLGADLPWLCGYEAMPLERPTVLVVPSGGEATLVVPALEAPRVTEVPDLFVMRPWSDGEDPIAIVSSCAASGATIGISDRAWASLVLGLEAALPKSRFVLASRVTSPLRAVKDPVEIAMLHRAGAAVDDVAEALVRGEIPLVGRQERAVAADISARLLDAGHARVNFAIVASGPNAASPHHDATDRVIGRSEAVVCDFGGVWKGDLDVGYCSDITRTIVTGAPDPAFVELYGVLERAQATAVAAVRPGVRCSAIDAAGRDVINEAGYGEFFIHRIGHGIGVEEHEDPYIVATNEELLVAGHSFSVEPGIYLPGRTGARIEDIVVVGEDAADLCNGVPRGLTVVEA